MIRPHLGNIINDHKTHGECKVHSDNTVIDTMSINFIASVNFEKTRTLSTKSDNIEIMVGNEKNKTI